jgi:putative membrane protein
MAIGRNRNPLSCVSKSGGEPKGLLKSILLGGTGSGEFETCCRSTNYVRGIHNSAEQESVVFTTKSQTPQKQTRRRRAFPRTKADVVAVSCTAVTALLLAAGPGFSWAQTSESPAASAAEKLSPADYNFVAQANLGAPFQIDSGRVAEKGATTAEIRDYAHLMVVTHIPVVDALNRILARKNIEAPANTLLHGAYKTMISSLNSEHGDALDRDYIEGQVDYQKGNEALFRNELENGSDTELKQFARATLPKIVDHLERAVKLAEETTASK